MSNKSHFVKSYVLRGSRISKAQKKAYCDYALDWILPFKKAKINWGGNCPYTSRFIVEIGFGMGEATRRLAMEHPAWNILAIEVYKPGIGKLLWWINQENLKNIRIIEHDAVEVVREMLAERSVDGFHIWFPDPWPKRKHQKRRLIKPGFIELLVRALKPGAYIHIVTDWEFYAEEIYNLLENTEGLRNRHKKWSPKPSYRPSTRFEERGLVTNRKIRDIIFELDKL
ncbi:tRNA (guanine(46)-N(7))-methyltransferase [Olavius algarvensis spirochete endosymbiont]|uniref:tRNA (guanosine(46)-N7)-methyltransferase TrmB n=1 Tax=Olavius algarvensis spirochete endosymbiont TaxID=260710 RepID=UPI00068EAA99|nr:tRNA (guanosine(46)-N7)-methyltransferase TrmB [Olavius algarvensis spirochete endosymbiont]CAD7842385.1 MAG: tRNA (guanine(46)-N(7))-methyltransferase (EC 2.1.1.33) [Olavius algarvensis spirochete endosymbiont]VDB00350.1 tRNA (guanine(46)-N(7))-methyltransferase [Olavius algarvensis spirochete endosymbiont]